MKVFLGHCHQDKALVQEIRSYLPKYISAWMDIRAPDSADINVPIRNAIQEEADFVIIFLGREAMKYERIRRECKWALEREKCFGYQSPYAGELFDIFSENVFFIRSIRKVVSRIISFLLS
jgi:hypothetical protein